MWRPASWWVVATLVFAASATYLLRRRSVLSAVLALVSFFLAGALTIQIRGSGAGDSQVWFGDGHEVSVTARVIAEGNLQSDAPGSLHQRLDVETEQVESGTETRQVRAGVRLNIYSGERVGRSSEEAATKETPPENDNPARMQLLRYGQRIRFFATLNPPHNFRNPGAFDYAEYLRDNGIATTASAKYASVEMLPGFSGSPVQLWRARIHRSIIGKVHALWPEALAGLMDAMVVGEESFINRPTRVDFQRSGTYHVLVVSGMNVSILAMFTLWTLRRLGLGDIAASACAIALILGYAALTNVGLRFGGQR
jgi:competence protein ComEC